MATIDLTLSDDDAPPAAPPVVHDLTLDSDSDAEPPAPALANAGEAPQPAPAPPSYSALAPPLEPVAEAPEELEEVVDFG